MTRFLILPGDVRHNFGDTAICLGTIALLRGLDPGARVSVWGPRPLLSEDFEGVEFLAGAPAALREARRCDAVLWGGGQLLQANRSRAKLPYQAARIGLVRLAGAPVIGFAQGVGPLPRPADRALAGRIARMAAAFTVRDESSVRLLERCGVPRERLRVTADPALLFDPPPAAGRAARRRSAIGLSLRYTGHHRAGRVVPFQLLPARARRRALGGPGLARFLGGFVGLVDRMIDTLDAEVVLVPMYPAPWETDELLARAIAERARRRDRVRIFRPRRSLRELTAALRGLDAFVGVPMHSTILATSQLVPTLALPYEPKGHEYLRRIGMSEWVADLREVDRTGEFSGILDRVRALLAGRERIRAGLARELPKMRRRAEENAEPLRELALVPPAPARAPGPVEREVV